MERVSEPVSQRTQREQRTGFAFKRTNKERHMGKLLPPNKNYEALPLVHGAPLRLRVENQLGYKMVQWIISIDLWKAYKNLGKGQGGKNEDDEYFDLPANT